MSDMLKLPRWGILSLIFMTVILSFVILVKIWFPDLIAEDLFSKIFMTYLVLVVSSAVISRMSEYLKKMSEPAVDKSKGSTES